MPATANLCRWIWSKSYNVKVINRTKETAKFRSESRPPPAPRQDTLIAYSWPNAFADNPCFPSNAAHRSTYSCFARHQPLIANQLFIAPDGGSVSAIIAHCSVKIRYCPYAKISVLRIVKIDHRIAWNILRSC